MSSGSISGSMATLLASLIPSATNKTPGADPNLDPSNTNLAGNNITSIKTINGQTLNQAYTALMGVMTNDPTTILAAGAAVHQPLDGYTQASSTQGTGLATVLLNAAPAGFYVTGTTTITPPGQLDPNVFTTWSSEYQAQYINLAMGGSVVDYNAAYTTALNAMIAKLQQNAAMGTATVFDAGPINPPNFYPNTLTQVAYTNLSQLVPGASQAWFKEVDDLATGAKYYVFDPSKFQASYQQSNPPPSGIVSPYAKTAGGGTDYRVSGGYIQIGASGKDASGNPLTSKPLDFYISPSRTSSGTPLYSGGKITCLETLTKTSFATMDTTTQQNIANYDNVMGGTAFQTLQTNVNINTDKSGSPLSLTAARSANLTLVTQSMQAIIASAQADGVDITPTYGTDSSGAQIITNFSFGGNGYSASQNRFMDGRLLSYNDVSVFLNELLNLQTQMRSMSVFSINDIQTKINAIQTRFNTVEDFGIIPNQVSASDLGAYWQTNYGTGLHDGQAQFDSTAYLVKNVVSSDTPNRNAVTSTVNGTNNLSTVYEYKIQGFQGDGDNAKSYDQYILDKASSSYDAAAQWDIQNYDGRIFGGNGPNNTVEKDDIVQVDGGSGDAVAHGSTAADGVIGGPSGTNGNPYTLLTGGSLNVNANNFSATVNIAGSNKSVAVSTVGAGNTVVEAQTVEMIASTKGGASSSIVGTNQSTIASGYQKLMQAEQQTLALQNQMNLVAAQQTMTVQNGNTTVNKQLDVPSLIFFLQLYTNLIDEQQNAASTELVNQQNDLLNTYSQMQDLVNSVQGKYKAGSDGQTQQLDIFGNDPHADPTKGNGNINNNANALTNQTVSMLAQNTSIGQGQITLLSMFDTNMVKDLVSGTPVKTQNPIERMFKIQRPTMQFFDDGQNGSMTSVGYTSTAFNSFGTSLSNAVTQINQQTQIMMNNIDSLDKEKNQHFDLANNCLSKLNDILAAIGRNTA